MTDYQILELLGRGASGEVYLVRDNAGQLWAAKLFRNLRPLTQQKLADEIAVLRHLSTPSCSPYVACYHDDYAEGNNHYLISEYVAGQTLQQLLVDLGRRTVVLEPTQLWSLYLQLVLGLEYIHSQGLAHRDIKPDNIIFTADHHIKYIDFGMACTAQCLQPDCTNICTMRPIGSPNYMAPELFLSELNPHSNEELLLAQARDVWALVLIMYILANLVEPWSPQIVMTEDPRRPGELVKFLRRRFRAGMTPSHYRRDDGRTNRFLDQAIEMAPLSRPTIGELKKRITEDLLAPIFLG